MNQLTRTLWVAVFAVLGTVALIAKAKAVAATVAVNIPVVFLMMF